ncbi:MAG: hypothetical protein AB1752_03310 [Candidatus Zixiibacteriota bacterium]
MITQEHIDLIQRGIDGALAPSEEALLKNLLESDPEVRREYERLTAVSESLSLLQDVELPAELHQSVMAAIRHRRLSARTREGWFAKWLARFAAMGQLQHGLTFAAGVAAGLLIFLAVDPTGSPLDSSIPSDQVSGTILRSTDVPAARPATAKDVQVGSLTGWVALESVPGGERVRMRLDTPGEAEVTLRYSPDEAILAGLRTPTLSPSGLSVVPGTAIIHHQGAGEYAIDFAGMTDRAFPIAVRIVAGGLTHEEIIRLNPSEIR